MSVQEKLKQIGQEHLLVHLDHLSEKERSSLLLQIEQIDLSTLEKQQRVLLDRGKEKEGRSECFLPFQNFFRRKKGEHSSLGLSLLSEGKVGVLIVAGGQGTRLRFDGPKGCFPVSVVKKKSLFQLFAERIVVASRIAQFDLPVAIMTSPQNHEETVQFFAENDRFGLKESQLSFFSQGELPLLCEDGFMFLETHSKVSIGADGNGSSLIRFVESGICADWRERGVQFLNFIQVDNALADPFDLDLIGYHAAHRLDVTIKCIEREDPEEKVGVIVEKGGKAAVIEYSEIKRSEMLARDVDGALKYPLANISLFCFSIQFVEEIAKQKELIPLHLAHKAVSYLDRGERSVRAEKPMAWKFERFIFDALPLAEKVSAIVYDRADCFSPLKNFKGKDSIDSVQAMLLERDRTYLSNMTGNDFSDRVFELSQDFYFATEGEKRELKELSFSDLSYIEIHR